MDIVSGSTVYGAEGRWMEARGTLIDLNSADATTGRVLYCPTVRLL